MKLLLLNLFCLWLLSLRLAYASDYFPSTKNKFETVPGSEFLKGIFRNSKSYLEISAKLVYPNKTALSKNDLLKLIEGGFRENVKVKSNSRKIKFKQYLYETDLKYIYNNSKKICKFKEIVFDHPLPEHGKLLNRICVFENGKGWVYLKEHRKGKGKYFLRLLINYEIIDFKGSLSHHYKLVDAHKVKTEVDRHYFTEKDKDGFHKIKSLHKNKTYYTNLREIYDSNKKQICELKKSVRKNEFYCMKGKLEKELMKFVMHKDVTNGETYTYTIFHKGKNLPYEGGNSPYLFFKNGTKQKHKLISETNKTILYTDFKYIYDEKDRKLCKVEVLFENWRGPWCMSTNEFAGFSAELDLFEDEYGTFDQHKHAKGYGPKIRFVVGLKDEFEERRMKPILKNFLSKAVIFTHEGNKEILYWKDIRTLDLMKSRAKRFVKDNPGIKKLIGKLIACLEKKNIKEPCMKKYFLEAEFLSSWPDVFSGFFILAKNSLGKYANPGRNDIRGDYRSGNDVYSFVENDSYKLTMNLLKESQKKLSEYLKYSLYGSVYLSDNPETFRLYLMKNNNNEWTIRGVGRGSKEVPYFLAPPM